MSSRKQRYNDYINSAHWRELRALALDRDNHRCCRCKSTLDLHVHHKIYRKVLEDGLLQDLETLCADCHWVEHYGTRKQARRRAKLIMSGKRPQNVTRVAKSDNNRKRRRLEMLHAFSGHGNSAFIKFPAELGPVAATVVPRAQAQPNHRSEQVGGALANQHSDLLTA
jgi:hypothetical protein